VNWKPTLDISIPHIYTSSIRKTPTHQHALSNAKVKAAKNTTSGKKV